MSTFQTNLRRMAYFAPLPGGEHRGVAKGLSPPPPEWFFWGVGGVAPPLRFLKIFSPLKTWFSFSMSILYVPIYYINSPAALWTCLCLFQGFGSGSLQNPDPGGCTSNGEIFSNVYKMIILDTIKTPLFCFYTFVFGLPLFEFSPDPGL